MNEEIRTRAGVTNISEKIRKTRLIRLGHVGRHRNIGRPRLRWSDVIRKDSSSSFPLAFPIM